MGKAAKVLEVFYAAQKLHGHRDVLTLLASKHYSEDDVLDALSIATTEYKNAKELVEYYRERERLMDETVTRLNMVLDTIKHLDVDALTSHHSLYYGHHLVNPHNCAKGIIRYGRTYQCSRKRGHGPEGAFCAQHAKEYEEET